MLRSNLLRTTHRPAPVLCVVLPDEDALRDQKSEDRLDALGEEPPVLRSSNLDGSAEVNRRRKARYTGRISLLGGLPDETTAGQDS